MTRHEAREKLMTVYFQMEARDDFEESGFDLYFDGLKGKSQLEYLEKNYNILCSFKEEIDEAISKHSNKWKISRIPKVDLAILRVAVAEMLYNDDIPHSVSINEAIEIAKKYSDDNSPTYINAILGAIAKELD